MNIVDKIISESNPIEEISVIDLKSFKKKYFNKRRPVLIKGLAKDWGATKKWNLDFLLDIKDDKDVDTLSGNFIQGDNSYKKVTFKNYIQKLKEAELSKKPMKDYLTTLDIFKYFPYLKKDIDFSLFEGCTKTNDITAWIGPNGTVSGFHADTANNMYAQINGKKMFIICSTKFKKNMYPSDKYIYSAVASKVDINNFNSEKYPKFLNSEFKIVMLEPGDTLFLPQNWWHYVQSLDTSISISNFGHTQKEIFTLKFKERVKHSLHKRGYIKPKNCFCCN